MGVQFVDHRALFAVLGVLFGRLALPYHVAALLRPPHLEGWYHINWMMDGMRQALMHFGILWVGFDRCLGRRNLREDTAHASWAVDMEIELL